LTGPDKLLLGSKDFAQVINQSDTTTSSEAGNEMHYVTSFSCKSFVRAVSLDPVNPRLSNIGAREPESPRSMHW
jgi:hypothetical protein